jgi:hypothetical protein
VLSAEWSAGPALLTQPGTIYDVTAPDLPTIRR